MMVRFVGGLAHNRFRNIRLLPDRRWPSTVDVVVERDPPKWVSLRELSAEDLMILVQTYQCCQLIDERSRVVFYEYHCVGDTRPFSGQYWFPERGF